MNSINGAIISMAMSKDLPEDLKRNNLITGMMLGDNQSAIFAQILNIKKQKETQEIIEDLEEQARRPKLADLDSFIVYHVNDQIHKSKESRQEDIAESIAPVLVEYVKKFHKGVLPKEFYQLNQKVFHLIEPKVETQQQNHNGAVIHQKKMEAA